LNGLNDAEKKGKKVPQKVLADGLSYATRILLLGSGRCGMRSAVRFLVDEVYIDIGRKFAQEEGERK